MSGGKRSARSCVGLLRRDGGGDCTDRGANVTAERRESSNDNNRDQRAGNSIFNGRETFVFVQEVLAVHG